MSNYEHLIKGLFKLSEHEYGDVSDTDYKSLIPIFKRDIMPQWRYREYYICKDSSCICTHHINNVFVIENQGNGNTAEVGSHCITKFDSADRTEEAKSIIKQHTAKTKGKDTYNINGSRRLCTHAGCNRVLPSMTVYKLHMNDHKINDRVLTVEMPFGKHKGVKLVDLVKRDLNYVNWIIKNVKDFSYLKELKIIMSSK